MRIVYHVMSAPQPLGLLLLAATDRGLRHVDFMDKKSLKRAIAAREAAEPGAQWEPSLLELRPLADQIEEFLTGARKTIEGALDPQGDELSLAVWKKLRALPFGETCTVADLARAIGQPRNLRAVAQAVLTNPLPIVVPCHRARCRRQAFELRRRPAAQEVPARPRVALPQAGRARRQPRDRRADAPRAAPDHARARGGKARAQEARDDAVAPGRDRHDVGVAQGAEEATPLTSTSCTSASFRNRNSGRLMS